MRQFPARPQLQQGKGRTGGRAGWRKEGKRAGIPRAPQDGDTTKVQPFPPPHRALQIPEALTHQWRTNQRSPDLPELNASALPFYPHSLQRQSVHFRGATICKTQTKAVNSETCPHFVITEQEGAAPQLIPAQHTAPVVAKKGRVITLLFLFGQGSICIPG